jgi:hypothetical protein
MQTVEKKEEIITKRDSGPGRKYPRGYNKTILLLLVYLHLL